jgi:lysozyme
MPFTPDSYDKTKVIILDVSFWQDDNNTPRGIDFNQMKANGASAVIIRAGQGNNIDSDFRVNWQAAKEAGLRRGSYWFLDAREGGNGQANLYKSLLANDPGEILPCVDYEHETTMLVKDAKGKSKSRPVFNTISQLDGFLTTFAWPVPIMIYTGYYYWRDHGSTDPRFAKHPLWIPRYKADEPLIPAPWTDHVLWQFSESGPGKAFGVESNAVDMNYFNGTAQGFEGWAKMPVNAPQTPPEAPDTPNPTSRPSVTLIVPEGVDWEVKRG